MKKYPKHIYVQRQSDDTQDEYLETHEDAADFYDDGKIAVYELKEMKTRRTEIHLE